MLEFSSLVTTDQSTFLATNKADLTKTDGGKSIWQNRVKMASEAYQAAKIIHGDFCLTALVPRTSEDEDDEVDSTFPAWPTYRDNFILDWIANRTIVTEKEADTMFERTAEEALQAIEQAEQDGAGASDAPATETIVTATVATPASEPTVAVKRRGRPPGSAKKATVVKATAPVKAKKSYYKPKTKVAAKKKSGGSASAKAQGLIEKYAARDWSRKDIIQKLQDQLSMGAAYASTLYQKFA